MIATLIALATGLGLSTAAGLNAFLPLLTIGILARFGLIDLVAPFALLTHPLVLLIVAALAVLDFVGDKVPAVDSALHAAGMIIAPIAGAVAAGSTHLARTVVRPVVTTATAGTGNPVLSFAEDGAALALSVLAVMAPALAIILVGIMAVVLLRVFRRAAQVWGERKV